MDLVATSLQTFCHVSLPNIGPALVESGEEA
jgi:ABC-type spermidine/putrescine transport system permease subunit II